MQITDEIRTYVEKKLASLDKFISDLDAARADVEVEFMRGEAQMYRAEFMIHDPVLKEIMRAEARGASLHEAIDIAVAEVFEELTRTKKKKIDLFRRSAVRVKEYLRGWRRKV